MLQINLNSYKNFVQNLFANVRWKKFSDVQLFDRT